MKRLVVLAVVVGAALVVALAVIGVRTIQRFDEHWSDPGNQTRFITPQAMSRGVGLVELHRLRHGRYPASLSDLRFLSGFDRAMLVWLEYASSEDGDAYYLAVDRDRPGAEGVTWPSGYWDGTGYDPALAPAASTVSRGELDGTEPATMSGGFDEIRLSGINLAVGQVELHKLRTGAYPETLDDLRFLAEGEGGRVLGQSAASWKNPSLAIVEYARSEDGLSYSVRIRQPVAGTAPVLLPEEYWLGTGYRASE
jgi:hypothetical protein